MERRDALRYTAFFMGLSMSGATISAIMSGCKTDDGDDWVSSFLSQEQSDFLADFGETIFPKTSTPGAKDAQVVRFIDAVRPLRYTVEDNEKFKTDLTAFIQKAKTEGGKEFVKLSPEKQLEWVTEVDKNSYEILNANSNTKDVERPFYIVLKEHIAGGYFSSELVMKEFFAFDPIPGRYDACIPYEDVGRAWAI
ncbi:MAG: gluconate 2-dehydrogenase subunit 3 family protein [Bacteroidota bacterium]|nr:gluconate 2-dehydrogenase subunit 3 family protein [Bacteroidota bacterium]